ncbi:sensor histidine kinase, partial [Micromonospora sp. CPCC 205371]|nr:sensor histidine kinase [Micromonospora sp. CPCC 205371]
ETQRPRPEERPHDGPRRRRAGAREGLAAVEERIVAGGEHLPRARAQLDQTLDELDDLARGLHPRDLAGGLAAALRALVARSAVPVALAVPGGRFAAEVEAAVYFVAAEALANVAKHASASSASVDVRRDESGLTVVVVDDGAGGAVPRRGLIGLADRVQALGGRLRVESPPGGGTTLTAYLPLERA